jgi:hypothetical protein
MVGRPQYTDEQIIDALKRHKGMIYLAAEALGCHPDTIRDRAKRVPGVRAVLEVERGRTTDVAELKLYQAVQNGEPWAINLMLKRQRFKSTYE